ncbi:hypothetical protein ACFW91_12800 [Streptomyces asoensis]|uniref:hypothetical protein n=1 Tax=Streptomyces asoensis TaxID=249586 RepID=UPI0036B8B728
MPSFKRPELGDGPKKELNAALHDLHLRAGLPSVRELVERVGGGDVAGRSRVHDAFSSPRLPAWGLVQILAEALVSKIPGVDPKQEEMRLHRLWIAASGQSPQDSAELRTPIPQQVPAPVRPQRRPAQPILAMRVEWAAPTLLDVDTRRSLREFISRALDDIGWPIKGEHRRDGSAGSIIMIDPAHEHPSVTTATFLATLDDEQTRSKRQRRSYTAALRFMAVLNRNAQVPPEALDMLNDLWTSPHVEDLWKLRRNHGGWQPPADTREDQGNWQQGINESTNLVSAVLYGLPVLGYFVGDWAQVSDYLPSRYTSPELANNFLEDASVRVSNTIDPWDAPF